MVQRYGLYYVFYEYTLKIILNSTLGLKKTFNSDNQSLKYHHDHPS